MKVKEFLAKHNIEKNSDVEFALCQVLNKKRGELFFADINLRQEKKFFKIYKALKKGKPLSLILKNANFFGRNFFVNRHVLKPRIDTEAVCEKALEYVFENSKVLDLCCGSGVIGLTIAKEKNCFVSLCDISRKALKVCKKNALNLAVKCILTRSDMFENIHEKYDVIVCNPPYIKTADIQKLDKNVKNFDPKIALDGGADGLDFYKKIAKEAPKFLNENGKLILEIGFDQAKKVLKLLKKDFSAVAYKDYFGNDRIVVGGLNGKTRKTN